jgi:hypothetical protein
MCGADISARRGRVANIAGLLPKIKRVETDLDATWFLRRRVWGRPGLECRG